MEKNFLEPSWAGTLVFIACLMAAAVFDIPTNGSVTETLKIQALIVGGGLAVSAALDFQGGLRNLVRVDLVCLTALYFLAYVEFLFPQPDFDLAASGYDVIKASRMVLLGMGCMALARHVNVPKNQSIPEAVETRRQAGLSANQWLALLWIAAALGYAHMLLAVQFNIPGMIEAMMKARFTQPWQRGRLGGWGSLLNELALFFYVIPPVYGILFAKRGQVSGLAFSGATVIALFTLFQGYSSGTRNVFAAYLAGGFGAYLLVQPRLKVRQLILTGALCGGLLYVASNQMLHFREIGLKRYLAQGTKGTVYHEESSGKETSFFVDANLLNMALMMDTVPARRDFTGWDMPYNALIRPIPRAIWPGKPEGLKLSIEEAAGMEGLTLAVSFIGEAYLSGGAFGVALAGLFFGGLCSIWNSAFRGRWNAFSQLVYVAGFYPAAISMRSLMAFTTAVLPIFGLLAISMILNHGKSGAAPLRLGLRRRGAGHETDYQNTGNVTLPIPALPRPE